MMAMRFAVKHLLHSFFHLMIFVMMKMLVIIMMIMMMKG